MLSYQKWNSLFVYLAILGKGFLVNEDDEDKKERKKPGYIATAGLSKLHRIIRKTQSARISEIQFWTKQKNNKTQSFYWSDTFQSSHYPQKVQIFNLDWVRQAEWWSITIQFVSRVTLP